MLPTSIAQAYRMFQVDVQPIVKEHKVEFGKTKYKFASLHEIKEVIDPLLRKHGLIVKQISEDTPDYVAIRTILLFEHDGTEWDMGVTMMPNTDKSNPQHTGKLITYCRRYAIVRSLGLSIVDACEVDNDAIDHVPKNDHRAAQKAIYGVCKRKCISDDLRRAVGRFLNGKDSTSEMTTEELIKLKDVLEKKDVDRMREWYEESA